MPNIYSPDFDEPRDRDGFRARRARIGYALRSKRLFFREADAVGYWDGEDPPPAGDQ